MYRFRFVLERITPIMIMDKGPEILPILFILDNNGTGISRLNIMINMPAHTAIIDGFKIIFRNSSIRDFFPRWPLKRSNP